MPEIIVTEEGVFKQSTNLRENKPSGPGLIPSRVLKIAAKHFTCQIDHLMMVYRILERHSSCTNNCHYSVLWLLFNPLTFKVTNLSSLFVVEAIKQV